MLFFDCYSIIKNSCDARCQGCGCCPICDSNWDYYREVMIGEQVTEYPKTTRMEMFKHWLEIFFDEINIIGRIYDGYKLRQFWKTPEGKHFIELMKSLNKKK